MLLQTEIVDLRKTTIKDLEFVMHAEGSEPNRRFIGQWSIEQHTAALEDSDILHLIIREKTGEPAGYVILTGLLDPNLSICIKRIVVQSKGRGYGKSTLALLMHWVFTQTPAHRLWLDVKDYNTRAHHVYVRAGFTAEGTLRDCIRTDDSFESLMIMSILRQEYIKRRRL
ncbi:GNAT family N-acetyltransferase [Paenibacillus riograndensis]|uniref:N-acetyltransferase GCN5 n=1 Tax=Paenibacillus riograndensis SBR5 TaxID=1073571 RepID=A0A0E3WJH0_9BACL|nr:GNAT family N-acetyltransferase [Paenibacillus riograndensis]CQR58773.1 N-acetyltransferase GCN5 [Paenibacillus riograndensis SBR5]